MDNLTWGNRKSRSLGNGKGAKENDKVLRKLHLRLGDLDLDKIRYIRLFCVLCPLMMIALLSSFFFSCCMRNDARKSDVFFDVMT